MIYPWMNLKLCANQRHMDWDRLRFDFDLKIYQKDHYIHIVNCQHCFKDIIDRIIQQDQYIVI